MAMSHETAEIAVAVFARAPVPGETKTRLIPRLGAEGAASLHCRLVTHMLTRLLQAEFPDVTLWGAPDATDPFFADCVTGFGVEIAAQIEGDLGARMHHAFVRAAPRPLLLVGTDCPSITVAHLHACAAALHEGADAVFLPAEDGGYGLVGLRRPAPEIFADMVWSTPHVMDETRRRLRKLGLSWREPAVIWDVDEPADYERLVKSGLMPLA